MQRRHPLPDTHPELSIYKSEGFHEYRIENTPKCRSVKNGGHRWPWRETAEIGLLSMLWQVALNSSWNYLVFAIPTVLFLWHKCSQVVSESIIVIPPHGIQLETRFGFQTFTINVTRRFIPLSTLRDVVINEGLYGWNVRYYLVAIVQDRSGATSLAVVFENILPRFPVLLEIYRGVHDVLSNACIN
ncbi:GPI-GlcNAc transferase complex, PIG-H component-domain-containing protein [Armillaria nabsnona]|nr:GPI-GlcNAc transferase complex, PIG-H component-domain-containing protein [Armillaria nabsnona]